MQFILYELLPSVCNKFTRICRAFKQFSCFFSFTAVLKQQQQEKMASTARKTRNVSQATAASQGVENAVLTATAKEANNVGETSVLVLNQMVMNANWMLTAELATAVESLERKFVESAVQASTAVMEISAERINV